MWGLSVRADKGRDPAVAAAEEPSRVNNQYQRCNASGTILNPTQTALFH
jgi:hypothetical protein